MRPFRLSRGFPLRPGSFTDPPGASWLFVAFSFVYAAGMLWAATGAATGTAATPLSLVAGAGTGVVAAAFARRYHRSAAPLDGASPYLFAVAPALVHVVVYYRATARIGGETTTAVLVQATLLVLVFGTYARPLLPSWVDRLDGAEKREVLDHHMRDWWGFTSLSVSVVLAFGIGVAAGLLRSGSVVTSNWFVYLAVTTFAGVAALWGYALAKVRAVGGARRRELLE